MPCRGEQSLIEAFVPQPLIEAFHESILCRRGGGCERKFAVEIFIVVIVVAVVLWLVGRTWIGSDHGAAMALVSRTTYQPRPVMGREEAFLFYKLENWVNDRAQGERVFAQVPMGVYLQTPDDAAHLLIRYKRPDYVIVNRQGLPLCVVEYQGGGHYQGDAHERDAIKNVALQRANIPLVEIFADEQNDAHLIRQKLDVAVSKVVSLAVIK